MKVGKQRRNSGNIKIKTSLSHKFGYVTRILLLVAIIVGFVWSQNNLLITKDYVYESDRIPKSFVGTKIAHITDLYNTTLSVESAINRANPDIIIVTGNLTDDNGNFGNSVKLLNNLAKNYKVYYVTGESDEAVSANIKANMNGPVCLENNRVTIQAPNVSYSDFVSKYVGEVWQTRANEGNESAVKYLEYTKQALANTLNSVIEISGLPLISTESTYMDQAYSVLNYDKSIFQILAINQSQYFDGLSTADVDLIVAGNTCGKDIYGTGYSNGLYAKNSTSLLVSNGVGNSDKTGSRFFNWPSIYIIELSDGTIDTGNPLEKFLGTYIYDVETRFDNDGGFKQSITGYTTYGGVYDN